MDIFFYLEVASYVAGILSAALSIAAFNRRNCR
jgi:hypothetical protein